MKLQGYSPPYPFDTILLRKTTQGERWSWRRPLMLVLFISTNAYALPEGVQQKLDSIFCDPAVRDGFLGLNDCNTNFLKKHGIILYDNTRRHGRLPSLPGYIIKGGRHGAKAARRKRSNIGRIVGAEKLRSIVEELNATHVRIPRKWLYHLPGMPDELNDDNYVVVVEKLDIVGHKENKNFLWKLQPDVARELRDVLLTARYASLHSANIYMLRDKQTVAIVDTEEYPNTPTLEYCLRQFKKMVDPSTVDALP